MIRFESNLQGQSHINASKSISVPIESNIVRVIDARAKQKEKYRQSNSNTQKLHSQNDNSQEKNNLQNDQRKNFKKISDVYDKENIATKVSTSKSEVPTSVPLEKETDIYTKPKMWIRSKSAQVTSRSANIKKRTDPVALYQEYQKDWERFKTNICESSRSELRWQIRERMANRKT